MAILVVSLLALGLAVALAALFSNRGKQSHDDAVAMPTGCAGCTGASGRCEQDCMMEAAVKEIEYYDDEELDAFRGREADSFSDEEVEQFSAVLYTMRPGEVAGWCRSLTLRGVPLPDQLKDEVLMIINDGNT